MSQMNGIRRASRSYRWAALLLLGVFVAACSSSAPKGNGQGSAASGTAPTPSAPAAKQPNLDATIRIALGADIATLDPHSYKSSIDELVQNLIYDTLVDADPKTGQLVPRLATSWQNVDPTTIRFKLRTGVKYQDGTPFNADAAKTSFDRAVTALKGKGFYGDIKETKVVDDSTLDVILKRPTAPLIYNMTLPVGGVMYPAAMKKFGANEMTDQSMVIGTGPFKFVRWTPKQEIVLERNENYWGDKPKIKQIILKPIPDDSARLLALRSGDVDASIDPPAAEIAGLRKDPKFTALITPQARMLWLGFNFNDPVVGKNLNLRKAIAYGIDRKTIVADALEGVPRQADDGPIPPEVIKTDPPLSFPYDPAKAKDFLNQAGLSSGVKLTLWASSGRYFGDKTIAQVVQAQLAKIGITVDIKTMEWGAIQDAFTRHEQQLYLVGWAYAGHPDSALSRVVYSKSVVNWSAYNNPKLDQMLNSASAIFDPAQEQKAYWDISKLLMDDVVMIPMYYSVNVWITSAKVHDFGPHPQEKIDLTKTWIEK